MKNLVIILVITYTLITSPTSKWCWIIINHSMGSTDNSVVVNVVSQNGGTTTRTMTTSTQRTQTQRTQTQRTRTSTGGMGGGRTGGGRSGY